MLLVGRGLTGIDLIIGQNGEESCGIDQAFQTVTAAFFSVLLSQIPSTIRESQVAHTSSGS